MAGFHVLYILCTVYATLLKLKLVECQNTGLIPAHLYILSISSPHPPPIPIYTTDLPIFSNLIVSILKTFFRHSPPCPDPQQLPTTPQVNRAIHVFDKAVLDSEK
ncbi:putative G-protein coupled receptor 113 [Platysternon megacephalum]|uniref:Putative G-protein coupled receptor 113 n=1 Tax=Platysternon megacephalum TaxID=55544 RepID=A0A4D9DXM8_9SAUR|nr:putative G-protein coupled receptor 113 [Platysternon megacephalum]